MSSNTVEQNTSLHHITSRAVWMTRLIISLTILVCLLIIGIVLYALSLISGAVIILIVSALLAYIIYPVVHFLQRYLPRPLAITIAYLVIVSLLAAVLYVVITSIIQQSASLVGYIQFLFTPQGQKQIQPVIAFLQNLGITQSQIEQFKGQVIAQLQGIIDQSSALRNPRMIQIAMDGRTVILRGKVADEDERRLAENLIRLTPGVRQVQNELEMQAIVGRN